MTWPRPAVVLVMSAWMVLWPGPAAGAPVTRGLAPAEADSLVWYIEDLEAQLRICEIRGAARADSLALRLEFMGYRLQWAEADRPRWWQRGAVAFFAGVVSAVVVLAQVLRISF